MIKQLGLAVAALALLAAPCAWAQGWREYVYAGDGFAIQVPAPPEVTRSQTTSTDGEPMRERTYTADSGGIRYRVTVAVVDNINVQREVAARMRTAREKGRLVEELSDLNICGELGEGVTVETAQGARWTTLVFHLYGRFYIVETIAPAALLGSAGPARFRISFRHLEMGEKALPSYFGDGC